MRPPERREQLEPGCAKSARRGDVNGPIARQSLGEQLIERGRSVLIERDEYGQSPKRRGVEDERPVSSLRVGSQFRNRVRPAADDDARRVGSRLVAHVAAEVVPVGHVQHLAPTVRCRRCMGWLHGRLAERP